LRAVAILLLLGLAVRPASAEPWYRGRHGTNRVVHVSLTLTGAALYPATRFLERDLAARCAWCTPPGVDAAVRDALVWHDTRLAGTLSDLVAHGATPTLAVGLVLAGTLRDPSWARAIDDLVPIAETVVITQWLTRGLKLAFRRQRPAAYHGTTSGEPNLSFPSGHTSRAFAVVTSAAVVARARGYATEPYLWAAGLAFAASAGYLRLAGDRHYLTDVVAGAALGTAAGLAVPRLMCRGDLEVVPTARGLALATTW
jgi:membrane-associated phospholipid phosphatase